MKQVKIDYTEMVFINPMNGYQETVSNHAIPATLFFGPLYLAYQGVWGAFCLLFVISIALGTLGILGLSWFALFLIFVVNGIFAFGIEQTIAKQYLRRGWKMERQPK